MRLILRRGEKRLYTGVQNQTPVIHLRSLLRQSGRRTSLVEEGEYSVERL